MAASLDVERRLKFCEDTNVIADLAAFADLNAHKDADADRHGDWL